MPFWRESKNSLREHFLRPRKSSKKNESTADNLHRVGSKGSDLGSAISHSSTAKEPFDPWLEAEHLLKKDETRNKIWEESIHILKSRLGLSYQDDGNATRVNDLRTFLDAITRRLDDKKWSVLHDIGQGDTRQKLTKVCQNVLLVKDVISPAAATSPPAAIACAGITVGLLLFIQAMEQHETLLRGLDTVSSLIPRLRVIEHHFLQRDADIRADLRRTIEKDMSRAICYLEKQTVGQFLMDMLKQDGWDGLLQDIERYDTSINAATSSAHVLEFDKKLDDVQDKLQQMQVWQTTSVKDQKKARLFRRLYTCPYKDRKDRNNKRVEGTCEWFTSHPQFTKWNESSNSELLWVSADPGCGKSVLTRYLADEYLPSGTRTVCYFFFKDDYVDQRQATVALSSIIRQLLIAQPHLVQDPLLDKSETSGDQLVKSFSELWSILVQVTADENAGEVICLFDALDECQDDDRAKLIQAIESLFLNKSSKRNVKFLMTSRPYNHIRRDFYVLEKSLPTIHLSGENEENTDKISGEIDVVINARVQDIGERNSLQQDKVDFIIEQLTSVDNRTYLWVSLALDVIKGVDDFSRGNVRKVIRNIPENVDAAYNRILDRSSDHSRARRLLHIVTAAERPLTLQEISLALAFSTKDQSIDDIRDEIQTDDEQIQRMIRGLCGLFLVVIDKKVYLFHQTAKEFLVRQSQNSVIKDTKAGTWKHSLYPEESHYVLADICTLYLCQDTTRDLFPGLMHYAAKNWATHFRRACVSSNDTIAKRGRTLCQTQSKSDDILIASYLGLTAVTKLLLDSGKVDLECSDSEYGGCRVQRLLWANSSIPGCREWT
ncbi:ankyrin repeat protein [Aspergillus similis]